MNRQQQLHLDRKNKYYKSPKYCTHCNKILPYCKRKSKFCNRSCSASYNNSLRGPMSLTQKRKISDTLTKSDPKFTKIQYNRCKYCYTSYYTKHHKNITNKICNECKQANFSIVHSYTCASCSAPFMAKQFTKYCTKCTPNIHIYRSRASFTFNIYNYPNEFNLDLIEQYGWYSPNGYKRRNKQPNLNGVSRDHLFSVKDGFENNIDPEILAHPANCKIMLHNGPNGNNSKNSSSSISFSELTHRIQAWDLKYNNQK